MGWVSHCERVIRWTDVIEHGRDERGEHGGRERERERGGLRNEQVLYVRWWMGGTADGLDGCDKVSRFVGGARGRVNGRRHVCQGHWLIWGHKSQALRVCGGR
jgi:hypothetical protein